MLTAAVLAGGLAVLSILSLADPFDLLTPALALVGVVLTPAWLLQLARSMRSEAVITARQAPAASTRA